MALHEDLAVDAAHAEVFDLEEFLDAVFRAPVNYQIGPMPLSFMPPKGAISVEMMPSFAAPSLTLPRSRGRFGWESRWRLPIFARLKSADFIELVAAIENN
jgi:hypothetical protein